MFFSLSLLSCPLLGSFRCPFLGSFRCPWGIFSWGKVLAQNPRPFLTDAVWHCFWAFSGPSLHFCNDKICNFEEMFMEVVIRITWNRENRRYNRYSHLGGSVKHALGITIWLIDRGTCAGMEKRKEEQRPKSMIESNQQFPLSYSQEKREFTVLLNLCMSKIVCQNGY